MYRALYRKWRPQRFADVVGQTAIVTALQNQISAGRIGHAYLFTGTRGTGKTTCAKIFAKAVNCLDTSSPDPCGECEICKGIDSGSVMDIIEMDAASNNGVDDIRDLRDEVAYLPSVCKYKVYIIDEVHMLSTAAFNALLKTMEEPPEHVIFILATTEVQKVPVTILSRCQRYDFTRITADDIAGRLLYVAGQEKIELDENAAQLIGRLADGAMRDALSILDTCAGVDNHVDEALVRRMAGVTDRGYLFEISDAIAAGDSVTALEKIAELRQQSAEVIRQTTTGIRVPKEALRVRERTVTDEDGNESVVSETGVYCMVGMKARFKPVDVLYSGDDFALVRSTLDTAEEVSKTQEQIRLRAGDEVIITAYDLYDGKVIGS